MEITQQPSTIGEMSPQHFETYMISIIKHVTDEHFNIIERRLDKLEATVLAMQQDIQEIKDRQSLDQSRFGLLEKYVIRHENQLERQFA